jgi:hypothetical protein
MSDPEVFVVHEFSVRPADQKEVEAALEAIVAHIRADHPEVLTCQTFKQWVGPRAHRGYVWLEGFASLTTMESGTSTQTCSEVWEPVYRLAQPGTVLRSVWLASAPGLGMRRDA